MNLEARRLARWTRKVLRPHGFSKENTLAVLIACRDELCQDLHHRVARAWGDPMDGRALAAMPWIGQTGMSAALSHAPVREGRRRLVVLHFAHIGEDPKAGMTRRDGADVATCGAIHALMAASASKGTIRISDPEQSLLALRLAQVVEKGTARPTNVPAMTELVRNLGLSDLKGLLAEWDAKGCDHALFSGTLVHGAEGDRVALQHAEVRVAGQRTALMEDG
jgi:hypothetical protein